ncbi:hypothetical protein P154DRAFT_522016 [Amniculicola lignicola CBS 123094]|uniref:Uncharacterized protein n=1 Tax=Amniculicola lignicola CBS 123094 TaxID=1392246 RepID=A0A6A5WJN8_9PLEO|nr:hypothetical protein P154DRAFT_522016 [Amniculicola lignicola CBS 123094]
MARSQSVASVTYSCTHIQRYTIQHRSKRGEPPSIKFSGEKVCSLKSNPGAAGLDSEILLHRLATSTLPRNIRREVLWRSHSLPTLTNSFRLSAKMDTLRAAGTGHLYAFISLAEMAFRPDNWHGLNAEGRPRRGKWSDRSVDSDGVGNCAKGARLVREV